jgi:predicted DNA-binding transcriptional regulator YafY
VAVRGDKGERTLTFASLDEAERELLRYGPDVEVIAPEELRARVAATAREVAALYVP